MPIIDVINAASDKEPFSRDSETSELRKGCKMAQPLKEEATANDKKSGDSVLRKILANSQYSTQASWKAWGKNNVWQNDSK